MSVSRGWGVPEQHLLPDAIVAFVDGELPAVPAQRVIAHLQRCQGCAAEATAQRQARGAVRSAAAPQVPLGLLSSLRSIPSDVDLPEGPDGLAVTSDGQLVAVQRPEKVGAAAGDARLGGGSLLGTSAPLGTGSALLGGREHPGASRRAVQGASVVVSGLVLGALVLVIPHIDGQQPAQTQSPGVPSAPAVTPAGAQVVRAPLGGADPPAKSTTPVTTTVSVSLSH